MTELIQRQSLLMTDIDSDTYMLFPLIKNENDQVVLNNDDKNASLSWSPPGGYNL